MNFSTKSYRVIEKKKNRKSRYAVNIKVGDIVRLDLPLLSTKRIYDEIAVDLYINGAKHTTISTREYDKLAKKLVVQEVN